MTDQQDELRVVETLTPEIEREITAGATVVHCPKPDQLNGPDTAFAPIFWNTVWTHGQFPHTLGLLIQDSHPALAGFPTEDWSNWQWHELLRGRRSILLDATIQMIQNPLSASSTTGITIDPSPS